MADLDNRKNQTVTLFITLSLTCSVLIWSGCNEGREHVSSHDVFQIEPVTEKNILFEELHLDTLRLEKIESSYVGFISVSDDSIRFIDKRFGWMFVFDGEGGFHQRYLGQGRGPKELPMAGIQFYSPTPEGGHFFIGSSADYYVFNQGYERVHQQTIRWQQDTPVEELARNPDPLQQRSYNLGYDLGEIMVTSSHVYLPLHSAPPPFSEFNYTTDLFAEQARVFARMNIESAQVEDMIGRYSPVFADNENHRVFSYFHNELIDDKRIAISYMSDSLIYITDLNFNVEQAFGFSGLNMNRNYAPFPATGNEGRMIDYIRAEFEQRGYYTSLTYIPERELLFRSYTRGGDSVTNGLQVYRGQTLIADVDVPKYEAEFGFLIPTDNFKVAGYIEPWFYSNAVIDEMEEEITIYRFRIDE